VTHDAEEFFPCPRQDVSFGGMNWGLGRVLSFTILILLIVHTVDAMLLQAEMAVMDSTPLPNLVVKVLLVLLIIAGGLARLISGRAQAVPRGIFRLWYGFTFFLMIETVILVLRFGYPTDYVLFSYNAYYYAILLLPLFFYFRGTLSEELVIKTLLVFFVPISLLGVAQHFSGSLLLPAESPNGYLQVMSWNFFGTIRGVSLFSFPESFGHFLALMGGLGLALCLSRNGSAKKGAIIIVLVLLAGYATFTRAVQLEIAFAMFTVWMFYRAGHRWLLAMLPLVYGSIGLFVAFVAPLLVGSIPSFDYLSTGSLLERYMEWAQYGTLWVANDLLTFLFGAGIAQNDRFTLYREVLIDNSFIAIGVHIGAIGLVLWFIITWSIWKYMLGELKRHLSPVRAAAAAACSVWLFASDFAVAVFFPLPFLLFLVTDLRSRRRESPAGLIPLQRKSSPRQIASMEGGAVAGPV
jgi:hypothetical protein